MIPPTIGPYSIARELGRGGMGVVYAGQHQQLGRWAAIKLLLEEGVGPDAQERFQRECEALGQLNHPGIVRVYESGQFQGRPFLALEFVEGAPLDELLAKSGPLEPKVAVEAMISICEAIAHAHDLGILHRDIKPANILWDSAQRPRVTDFGLAKDLSARSLTASGTMLGTPAYMPPEQASGDKAALGPPADVYGLGATLFAFLTGVAPFQGASPVNIVTQIYTKPAPPPSSHDSSIDAELDALVLRCLEKEPQDRYPDARALANALRGYLAGEPTEGGPPRRGRGPLLAGISVLLLLGGGFGVAWGAGSFSPPKATPPPDPAQLAERARRSLLASKTSAELTAWLETHAPHASDEDRSRARRRLGDLTWRELEKTHGVAGGGDPLPPPGDRSRLLHYRAILSWIETHGRAASKVPSEDARKALARMRVPNYVLVLLPGTPNERDGSQDGLFLSDDEVLVHGDDATSILYDLRRDWQRDLLLGERGEQLKRVVSLGPGAGLRGLCARAIVTTPGRLASANDPRPTFRLQIHIEAKLLLPLGERSLLTGRRRLSQLSKGEVKGGFAALIPNDLLDAPGSNPHPIEELFLDDQILAVARGRLGIYVAGGGHDSSDGNGFLARIQVHEGSLSLAQSVSLPAAGQALGISPEEDVLVVGLNRGGARGFPIENGGIAAERYSILEPKKSQSAAASIGGAAVQIQDVAFLPHGSLLLSSDIYSVERAGFLSAWSGASFRSFRSKAEHEDPDVERVAPDTLTPLDTRPRSLVLSPSKDLLAIGSQGGSIRIIATPGRSR